MLRLQHYLTPCALFLLAVMHRSATILGVSLCLLLCAGARAETTQIAVASNFAAPMQALAAEFNRQSGHQVKVSLGSSGQLFAQIRNGAPFDLFLSADSSKPLALVQAGQAKAGTRFTYAIGTLALISADGGDAHAILQSDKYTHIAIANPTLAPYGSAAVEVLQKTGVYDRAKPRIVMAENIAQSYQFVSSGNAQLGFVALSQLMDNSKIPTGAWIVPASLHTPILQDAVLLTRGENNRAAKALLDFLHSDSARTIITQFGYSIS